VEDHQVDQNPNTDRTTSNRSIYNKVLNDYALKPSYTSNSAQQIKSQQQSHLQKDQANHKKAKSKIKRISRSSSNKPKYS
jgi:hypothetical protein